MDSAGHSQRYLVIMMYTQHKIQVTQTQKKKIRMKKQTETERHDQRDSSSSLLAKRTVRRLCLSSERDIYKRIIIISLFFKSFLSAVICKYNITSFFDDPFHFAFLCFISILSPVLLFLEL